MKGRWSGMWRGLPLGLSSRPLAGKFAGCPTTKSTCQRGRLAQASDGAMSGGRQLPRICTPNSLTASARNGEDEERVDPEGIGA